MLPHSSSIRDFYHFDDTKDNQRFFLIARPLWVVFKDVMYVSPPPYLLSLFPFSFLLLFLPLPPALNPCTPAMRALASSVLWLQLHR